MCRLRKGENGLEMGLKLFRSALGRDGFLRTGFTCTHSKSSGNKPEQDAIIMSVIGLINVKTCF